MRRTWLLLITLTVVSTLVGREDGTGSDLALLVLAVAAFKARLVGLSFMELRGAPWPLRAAFEAYCLLSWGLLAGLFLWA